MLFDLLLILNYQCKVQMLSISFVYSENLTDTPRDRLQSDGFMKIQDREFKVDESSLKVLKQMSLLLVLLEYFSPKKNAIP